MVHVLTGSCEIAYGDWAFGTLFWRQDFGNICFGKRKSSIKYNQPVIAYLPTVSKFQKKCGVQAMRALLGERVL